MYNDTKYRPETHANVKKDNFKVEFYRKYKQDRNPMSDDPRKDYIAQNEFQIKVTSIHTTEEVEDHGDYSYVTTRTEYSDPEIFEGDKPFANTVWKLAKKHDDYNKLIKEIDKLTRI